MFSFFHKNKEQKELFFQLDREFKKTYDKKIAGVYAIYKSDICLYVGQSKNIASRIATHLNGKYKICSKILIFTIEDESDDLIPLEKFLIQKLTPIENVLADFTEKIEESEIAEGCISYEIERAKHYEIDFNIDNAAEFTIINDKYALLLMDSEAASDLYHFDEACLFLHNITSSIVELKNKEKNEH